MVLIWILLFCRLVSVVLTTVGHSERSLQSTSQLGKCCVQLLTATSFILKHWSPPSSRCIVFTAFPVLVFINLWCLELPCHVLHTLALFPGLIASYQCCMLKGSEALEWGYHTLLLFLCRILPVLITVLPFGAVVCTDDMIDHVDQCSCG